MLVTHGVLSARHPAVLLNALDLHSRAADQFVRLAGQFVSEIRVSYDGREVNGKSLLDFITLAAACGTQPLRPPALPTPRPCCFEPRLGPLPDEVSLELGEL